MPEIGPMEILVIAVVALIVFGPEKLPDMARNVGRFLNDLRRMSTEVRSEVTDAFNPDPTSDDGFKPAAESETEASRAQRDPADKPAPADEGEDSERPSPTEYPTRRPKTSSSGDA